MKILEDTNRFSDLGIYAGLVAPCLVIYFKLGFKDNWYAFVLAALGFLYFINNFENKYEDPYKKVRGSGPQEPFNDESYREWGKDSSGKINRTYSPGRGYK